MEILTIIAAGMTAYHLTQDHSDKYNINKPKTQVSHSSQPFIPEQQYQSTLYVPTESTVVWVFE
jgi:hypothetical protein